MNIFTIELDKNNGNLYTQIYDYLANEIKNGSLKTGEKLPSSRLLASHLNLSRNTISTAYELLCADGYIASVPQKGFYVSDKFSDVPDKVQNLYKDDDFSIKYNFSTNYVDVEQLDFNKFAKLYRDTIYNNPSLLEHGEKIGDYTLRKEISRFVYETKNIKCSPNQVIIGAGLEYLFLMLTILLGKDKKYAFEDPCYRRTFDSINNITENIALIKTNKDGFDFSELKNSRADVFYTMPSHQYPMGYKLSEKMRLKLLNWVNEAPERYIIEDDYDGDFSYEKNTFPLKSYDKNDKIIYFHSFSRLLTPSIKTSFFILPKKLTEEWIHKFTYYSNFVGRFEQHVIAEFIKHGNFFKHINKMKNLYKRKRNLLISKLNELPFHDKLEIFGECAGTHLLIKYNCDIPQDILFANLKKVGIKMLPLSVFYISKLPEISNIFVVGFGGLKLKQIPNAVNLIKEAWDI